VGVEADCRFGGGDKETAAPFFLFAPVVWEWLQLDESVCVLMQLFYSRTMFFDRLIISNRSGTDQDDQDD
jgi:hypothetical protein